MECSVAGYKSDFSANDKEEQGKAISAILWKDLD